MGEATERILTLEQFPQFREADADGLVGLRGYMSYFQDAATRYMHDLRLGNDTMPEERGICWIYLKYKLHICCRVDFSGPLQLECWVEDQKPTVRLYQDLVISKDGEACAFGRLEECLLDMEAQKICRLSTIGWIGELASPRKVELEPFSRPQKGNLEGVNASGTHRVQYTDLDKSGHMNNLRYVDVLLNAFDSAFWTEHPISDFEIHYLSQCFEGEKLQISSKVGDSDANVWVVKSDGSPACVGIFGFARKD